LPNLTRPVPAENAPDQTTTTANPAPEPANQPGATAGAAVRVGPASHLTLHYRLTIADSGADVINTFEGKPATLQLGIGQMAEQLESRLQGLEEGTEAFFDLAPAQAFGERNPELIQRVSRAMLTANGEPGRRYVPGDLLEFPAPNGDRFAGVLKEIDDRSAVFDFNHPLAGQRIHFQVRILGIL
jgi:FKBP-type peptidyl-prolyl cis-trans isomerase SlpA